jgi:hypothetical protein
MMENKFILILFGILLLLFTLPVIFNELFRGSRSRQSSEHHLFNIVFIRRPRAIFYNPSSPNPITLLDTSSLPDPLPHPTALEVAETLEKYGQNTQLYRTYPTQVRPIKVKTAVEWLYKIEVIPIIYQQTICFERANHRGPASPAYHIERTTTPPTTAFPGGLFYLPDSFPSIEQILKEPQYHKIPIESGKAITPCTHCKGLAILTGPIYNQAEVFKDETSVCEYCKGEGVRSVLVEHRVPVTHTQTRRIRCNPCNGSGSVLDGYYDSSGSIQAGLVQCRSCGGSGGWDEQYSYETTKTESEEKFERCEPCNGKGKITRLVPKMVRTNISHYTTIPCTNCNGEGFFTENAFIGAGWFFEPCSVWGNYSLNGKKMTSRLNSTQYELIAPFAHRIDWEPIAIVALRDEWQPANRWIVKPESKQMSVRIESWLSRFIKDYYQEILTSYTDKLTYPMHGQVRWSLQAMVVRIQASRSLILIPEVSGRKFKYLPYSTTSRSQSRLVGIKNQFAHIGEYITDEEVAHLTENKS